MTIDRNGIETDPRSNGEGVDFDFETSAVSAGVGRVAVRTMCDGLWRPMSPVEVYDAMMDAQHSVVGGGQPNNSQLALAMEILYRDSWWLDFQRSPDEYPACSVEDLMGEPSDVFEGTFEFGNGVEPASVIIFNMAHYPLTEYGIGCLVRLLTKMTNTCQKSALDDLDKIIIANTNNGEAFLFYGSEYLMLSVGLLEQARTVTFDGRSYSSDSFLSRIARLYGSNSHGGLAQTMELGRFEGFVQASPRPVWIEFDPTYEELEEGSTDY